MGSKKNKILCIDDNKLVRDTFGEYLKTFGYEAILAENGKKGLELFRKEKPDAVLVDLLMPEIDGLTVLKTIKSESLETPVIVISGAGLMLDVIEALRNGACDYITKPIEDMTILKFSLEKCLEHARLLKENDTYKQRLKELSDKYDSKKKRNG